MIYLIKNENIRELEKKFNENKLSHVFLIETNDFQESLLDVLELCKRINCSSKYSENCEKCNICHLIDTQSLPSLKIIFPDGQFIRKEQMEELKLTFSYVPYITNYNIYIINEAEKFNRESANTILKFMEEPEKNIIGFLITNNKENVINTIKSRCEIVKASYMKENTIKNEELISLVKDYLKKIEVEKNLGIVYNKIVLEKNLEKNDIIDFFHILLDFYVEALKGNNELKELEKLSQLELIKRVDLVNQIIERLNYNVNINLLFDYFVLSLEE